MFQDKVFNIVSRAKMSKLETLNAFVWNNTATGLQTFLNMVGETLESLQFTVQYRMLFMRRWFLCLTRFQGEKMNHTFR